MKCFCDHEAKKGTPINIGPYGKERITVEVLKEG